MRLVAMFFAAAIAVAGCASADQRAPDGAAAADLAAPGDWQSAADHCCFEAGPDLGPYDLIPTADFAPPADKSPPDKWLAPDKSTVKPDVGPLPAVIYFSNFETSNGGLFPTKDWQWGVLAFAAGPNCDSTPNPPPSAHSGTRVWGTQLNDCYSPLNNAASSCANVDTTDDSILNLEVQIPASYSSVSLEYWEWNDYFSPYDWAEIRANGQVIHQSCGTFQKPTVWVKQTVSLDAFIGKGLLLQFHFMATGVVNYSGWYIDDLKIYGS